MKTSFKAMLLASTMALPAAVSADNYSATVAAGHPPVFRWVKMIDEAFVPAVEKALEGTGHSIDFMGQYGGSIASVGEELEAVEAGLAEIGTCQALFDPAKMAPQNVTYYTPFVTDDMNLVANMMHELQENDPNMQKSYADNGVVYLGAPIVIDDYILMTNFPVESLDDLKGKKIGAPGAAINWLSGTGAVGVAGNLTTYYNDIKTGVFDGVLVFATAALPGKLYEVAPNITRAGLGAQYAGSLCANVDWFESLPADVQDALTSAADDAGAWYLAATNAAVETSFKVMGENGATISLASDEMRQQWADGMDNAAQIWAKGLDDKGQNGSAILGQYLEAVRANGVAPVRDWDQE